MLLYKYMLYIQIYISLFPYLKYNIYVKKKLRIFIQKNNDDLDNLKNGKKILFLLYSKLFKTI